jgi:hypothetical protein
MSSRCTKCSTPKPIYTREEYLRRQNYHNYKNGAARRGYDWLLSLEEFLAFTDAPCNYCGLTPAKGVDRQDNSKGYLIKNCTPCCKDCNLAKRDMSEDVFIVWIARLAAFQGFSL